MGFYGNITNTSKTQFQFDRIYSSRSAMENKIYIDNVYAGRYVLVEYDSTPELGAFSRIYFLNGVAYTSSNYEAGTGITKNDVDYGDIRFTAETNQLVYKNCTFYVCTSERIEGSTEWATWEKVVNSADPYVTNYNIDIAAYGSGRGYDSTVWQKAYIDGSDKYIQIAELNSVVPTFDIAVDAPTMTPINPHFDINSTNVYYKLHVQPQWGFRVAENENLSDEEVRWTTTTYDPKTDKTSSIDTNKNGAIYYNKKAFDKQLNKDNIHKKDEETDNTIKIVPTGKSGNKYNIHGSNVNQEKEDIQELTINLPAIGNMMSDAWDIIHGPNRDNARTDENSSLQGRLDTFKEMAINQIPVKRMNDGVLVSSTINGATSYEDWSEKPLEILHDNTNPEFERDDAWIKTIINTSELNGGIKDGDNIDQSNNSGISIHHTFHATEDSESSLDKNTGIVIKSDEYKENYIPVSNDITEKNDMIKLYTPYVDAKGHIVGKNIETITLPYSYRFFEAQPVTGISEDDLYTQIINQGDGNNTSEIINATISKLQANQTQDTFTFKPVNKWIQLKLNNIDDSLSIAHEIHAINEVARESDLNNNSANHIIIQDIDFDEAGHVLENHKHTYTLPYGYKIIKTNGRSSEVAENAIDNPVIEDIVADKTQDTLNINSGNKWIRIDNNAKDDILTIRHDVHEILHDNNTTNWTQQESDTTIPVITYNHDEAGHLINTHTENYQLPFGYGKINSDEGTTTATTTYDELTFTSDEWLTAKATNDTITYYHDYPKKTDDKVKTSNVNNNGDTIILETLDRDEKGHVISVTQNTVTLPYGYKTFNGDSGTTSADNTQDSISVTGDNWINTLVENDSIKLSHKNPVIGTVNAKNNDTPNFGSTFIIDDHYFDEKGHKFESKAHTVKIPELSLSNGIGNVVTGLSLSPTTGAFTETKTNLGAIQLGTFEKGDSSADIAADITLQQALSRLENKISNEVINREQAIANLPVDTLNTGSINGTIAFNNVDVAVKGLGTAAYTDIDAYATFEQGQRADSALQQDTAFDYNDDKKTIAELFALVAELSIKVQQLEKQLNPEVEENETT